jgi:hypothetical protein
VGIDLYLLPVNGDFRGKAGIFYAHALIPLDRNAIIGDIRDVADKHAKDIPEPLSCFVAHQENGEHGYGYATEDPYGEKLTYVLAKHLKPLARKLGVTMDVEPKTNLPSVRLRKASVEDGYQSFLNQAAFAYILALPDDFKLVLYWH